MKVLMEVLSSSDYYEPSIDFTVEFNDENSSTMTFDEVDGLIEKHVRTKNHKIEVHGIIPVACLDRILKFVESSNLISELVFYNCNIGNEGAIRICNFILMNNPTVKNIDLTKNNINDLGARILLRSMEKNFYITSLRLGNNEIDQRLIDDINRITRRNFLIRDDIKCSQQTFSVLVEQQVIPKPLFAHILGYLIEEKNYQYLTFLKQAVLNEDPPKLFIPVFANKKQADKNSFLKDNSKIRETCTIL